MKKALAILMIFALVASVAVAEISVGAWGRGLFAFVSDGDETYTTNTASWGPALGDAGAGWDSAPRIGFTLAGNSDNVGVQADFNVDGGSMNLGDNQYIWVKPMDMLKISLGNMYDDTLRGNAAFGSYDWLRPMGAQEGEDAIFSRGGMNRGGQNFAVSVQPVEAFYALVYLANVGQGYVTPNLAENLTKNMQFAAGYTIEGTGQIRAQFLQKSSNSDDTGVVEVAFKLTMIENLYADFGFAMPLDTDVSGDYKKIAAYANYAVDAAKIHFLAIYNLLEDDDEFNIAAGVDYDMGEGIGINADVRYYNDIWAGGEDAMITFMAGVSKGFSNGKIGAGVQVVSVGDTYWAIPVKMEYWF